MVVSTRTFETSIFFLECVIAVLLSATVPNKSLSQFRCRWAATKPFVECYYYYYTPAVEQNARTSTKSVTLNSKAKDSFFSFIHFFFRIDARILSRFNPKLYNSWYSKPYGYIYVCFTAWKKLKFYFDGDSRQL